MATVRGRAEDVQLRTMIGRQGSNINEIQVKTETRINFRDELETNTHRVATVRIRPRMCRWPSYHSTRPSQLSRDWRH